MRPKIYYIGVWTLGSPLAKGGRNYMKLGEYPAKVYCFAGRVGNDEVGKDRATDHNAMLG